MLKLLLTGLCFFSSLLAHNLVDITEVNPYIKLDIRYATHDNFLGFPVYPFAACYLQEEAAEALNQAQLEAENLNLSLKVFDGYRPLSVQQMMWDLIQDERYVSNPAKNKGRHTRGTAVDLTLIYSNGTELEMPTGFDDFTERAHSDFMDLPENVIANRNLLQTIMEKQGFKQLPFEWWHFDYTGWNNDEKYPPLDISFYELKN